MKCVKQTEVGGLTFQKSENLKYHHHHHRHDHHHDDHQLHHHHHQGDQTKTLLKRETGRMFATMTKDITIAILLSPLVALPKSETV